MSSSEDRVSGQDGAATVRVKYWKTDWEKFIIMYKISNNFSLKRICLTSVVIFISMNFSLPGKFIFLHTGPAHNSPKNVCNVACSEGFPTATLGLSPHQTDRQRELAVSSKILVLGLILLAVLPRPLLLPPKHEEDTVAVYIPPVIWALSRTADTGEVPRVGDGHGQP